MVDAAAGEEFRDDRRRRLPIPPGALVRPTARDPLSSSLAILTTVAITATSIVATLTWWSPGVVVPAVLVIAAQQQACFVLAHDAAHHRLPDCLRVLVEYRFIEGAEVRNFLETVGLGSADPSFPALSE